MPTDHFFRTSMEKQERVLTAAKKEFSEHAYADTLINRIIKDAGIARGSFYLYFADKEDLFFYIFQKDMVEPLFQKYQEKYKGQPVDLFELGLYFFDLFVEMILNKEGCLFHIFTTINMKQLSYFLKLKRSGKYENNMCAEHMEAPTIEKLGEFISIDKLKYDNLEELLLICETVKLAVTSSIISMLLENRDAAMTREKLMIHFQLLERGFSL